MDRNQKKISKQKELVERLGQFFKQIYPLGFKSEAFLVFKHSVPLVLSMLTYALFQMMSIFFCGHMGADQLSGVSLAGTFITVLCSSPLMGMASASDTLMPQMFGSGKKTNVGLILQKACIILFLTSVLCVGLVLNSKNIMTLFLNDYATLSYADEFIRYFSPSVIFMGQQLVLQRYLQAQNILYPVMVINVIATLLNALLHYLFVFSFGLGIKGSAIVLVIVSFLQVVALIAYIFIKKLYKTTWPGWSFDCLCDWKVYIRLGIAGIGLFLLDWAFFQIAMILAATLGNPYLPVMSIFMQIVFFIFVIPYGIGHSGNIRVGQLLGENRPAEAINSAKCVLSVSWFTSLVLAALMLILSGQIPLAFTNDPEIVEQTSNILKFFSVVVFFDGLQISGFGMMRSVGAQKYGLIISFVGFYVVAASIGYSLLLKSELHIYGFWLGYLIGAVCMFIAQMIFVSRIVDWTKVAEEAHKVESKNENVTTTNREKKPTEISQIVASVLTDSPPPPPPPVLEKSLRSKLVKKGVLFLLIGAMFIGLFVVKDLRQIEPPPASSVLQNSTKTNLDISNSTFRV